MQRYEDELKKKKKEKSREGKFSFFLLANSGHPNFTSREAGKPGILERGNSYAKSPFFDVRDLMALNIRLLFNV